MNGPEAMVQLLPARSGGNIYSRRIPRQGLTPQISAEAVSAMTFSRIVCAVSAGVGYAGRALQWEKCCGSTRSTLRRLRLRSKISRQVCAEKRSVVVAGHASLVVER